MKKIFLILLLLRTDSRTGRFTGASELGRPDYRSEAARGGACMSPKTRPIT